MINVSKTASEIATREGGFVDDPNHPRGPGNFGIRLDVFRTAARDEGASETLGVTELAKLKKSDAVKILAEYCFARPKLDLLPDEIQRPAFDAFVMQGTEAVRILQNVLTAFGKPARADGYIGAQTAALAEEVMKIAPAHFADAYAIARRNHCYILGDASPTLRRYCMTRSGGKGGWVKRTELFMAQRYHLSDTAHQKRCQTWL